MTTTQQQEGSMVKVVRPGDCQHPQVSDETILGANDLAAKYWDSNAGSILCPDCKSYLYPDRDENDDMVAYVDEPKGAGEDYWGRPSPQTHPEYWTE